jgi:5-methyltetrahydropteroyltriglutamate--homocysteine methyltransferase
VPVDLNLEKDLDPGLRRGLAFGAQKLEELAALGKAIDNGRDSVANVLDASEYVVALRRTSTRRTKPAVARRLAAITPSQARRGASHEARRELQRFRFALPAYPTTTIGPFPQTQEVRKARAAHADGAMNDAVYEALLRKATADTVRWQEEIGLDVLVHGEYERHDIVQYFGEQLDGYAFTRHGWVQSCGSSCARPPIIHGDVSRPAPMSVAWPAYAQSLTTKPVKAALTGPVTMLQRSFVRDDQPRADTCRQIALALRDEVIDLEKAGLRIIQIDEPALWEGLPLRRSEWPGYLDWATECFRLSTSGVDNDTQIHLHMDYPTFDEVIGSIGAMDADVVSIGTDRPAAKPLDALAACRCLHEIGLGVYDVHAPRPPSVAEMIELLKNAQRQLGVCRIWMHPDGGLKTRCWEEVRPVLIDMVAAAAQLRRDNARAIRQLAGRR